MNARFILLLSACTAAVALRAQPTAPPPDAPPPPPGGPADATAQIPARTPEQLDQLLGPIALYPDALVAVILPASTVPSDIVMASRFLAAGGAPESVDNQPWDDSVKSLAHYPEVVKWMDDNLEWTKELGETFVAQPADVMKAVQRLRAKAQAVGSLKSTPEQQVVMEGQDICIVPAQPDVIYVPRYDPAVVYVQTTYYTDPFLTFGVGFAVGSWLYYDCDWGHRVIWVGPRSPRGGWRPPTGYPRPHYASNPDWRYWRPSPGARFNRPNYYYHPRQDIVRPRPYTGASPRPSWPRGAGAPGNPNGPGRPGRDGPDNHTGGPARPWPRLTNEGQGTKLAPAPGVVAPQEGNRPPGGRPTPAPNVNGPRNGNFRPTRPEGGGRHGEPRSGGNPPAPAGPQAQAQPAPAAAPRPVAGPPPVRQSAPVHTGAPHVQGVPHVPPTPRTPPAPAPRPADKDKNQN